MSENAEPEHLDGLLRTFEQMDTWHPDDPLWYLPVVGVEPNAQGTGLGGALMRHALARCDQDLARVVRIGLTKPEELDADEYQQFRYFLMAMLRVHEDMFVQHRAGVVDDQTWIARSSSLRTIFSMP